MLGVDPISSRKVSCSGSTLLGLRRRPVGVPRARPLALESGGIAPRKRPTRRRRRGSFAAGPRDPEIDSLVKQLSKGDSVRAPSAARRLGQLRAIQARSHLERALQSTDVRVRLGATSALGLIGDRRSRAALEACLDDSDRHVRAQAAYALSRMPDRRSSARLIETLSRDGSALVRNSCAIALGRIGDLRGIPALERALEDESDRVRREAVVALERSADPDAARKARRLLRDPARRVRIAATVVLGLRRDRGAVPELVEFSQRADVWEKPALLVALGRIGTRECGVVLARCADDPARWVRVCALHGLAEMRAPEARGVARAKLTDSAWAVRGAAALALGKVGTLADGSGLVQRLADPSAWVRRAAVYALGQLNAKTRAPAIRRAFDDPDPEVQLAAIWSAGHLEDRRATPQLVRWLERAPARVTSTRRTLVEGDGAVRLVSDADERRFDALVQAVGAIASATGDPAARAAIVAAYRRVPVSELGRRVRLPTPLGVGDDPRTLRGLFGGVLTGGKAESPICRETRRRQEPKGTTRSRRN